MHNPRRKLVEAKPKSRACCAGQPRATLLHLKARQAHERSGRMRSFAEQGVSFLGSMSTKATVVILSHPALWPSHSQRKSGKD